MLRPGIDDQGNQECDKEPTRFQPPLQRPLSSILAHASPFPAHPTARSLKRYHTYV